MPCLHPTLKNSQADDSFVAPLTSREREMADLKEAEGTEVIGSSARRTHAGAQLGMEWDQAAEEAIESLSRGEKKIVQLVSKAN